MREIILYIYPVSILFLAFLLFYLSRKWAVETRKKRRQNIEDKVNFEAIRTKTPLDEPKETAQKRAYKSVEHQFTITKKLFITLLIVVSLATLSIPFLDAIPASLISFIIASTTVIIGIAARPFVENVIAGYVISSSKILNLGDTVKLDENYGTVEDITSTHLTIKTWDWKRYVIPNSKMLNSNVINYTLVDKFQWAYVEFRVAFDSDVTLIEKLAKEAATKSRYYAKYEEPRFWVMDLDKDSYRCWIAAWADLPSEGWALKNDIRTELIRKFQEHNIKTHSFNLDGNKPS